MRPRLASGAAVLALALAGCGGDEPPPFKEVKPATTTVTHAVVTADEPADLLPGLRPAQRKALAALASAQADLDQRAAALAAANEDAAKLVQHVGAGYEAPSGSSPEVRRLADALGAFAAAVESLSTSDDLLPQLSVQLQLRYEQLVKKRPTVAAHLLEAKQDVDATLGALPALGRAVDAAAEKAKAEMAKDTLDAEVLDDAITSGAESSTSALNGVDHAVETGLRALAAAA